MNIILNDNYKKIEKLATNDPNESFNLHNLIPLLSDIGSQEFSNKLFKENEFYTENDLIDLLFKIRNKILHERKYMSYEEMFSLLKGLDSCSWDMGYVDGVGFDVDFIYRVNFNIDYKDNVKNNRGYVTIVDVNNKQMFGYLQRLLKKFKMI